MLAGMGNALMAQPMIRQLASGLDARPTVFARNASIAGVFDRLPEVADVRIFGNEPRQFARLLKELRRFRADVLVVPYPSNRWQYSLLAAASGAKRVVLHDYPAGKVRALHGLVRDRVPTVDARHDVLSNLDLLRPLEVVSQEDMRPMFPVRLEEVDQARERLRDVASDARTQNSKPCSERSDEPGLEGSDPDPARRFAQSTASDPVDLSEQRDEEREITHDFRSRSRFCAVHAGSGRTVFAMSKRWHPSKFGTLVPRLRELGYTPVLLEGPEDQGVGDLLEQHTDAPVLQLDGTLAEAAAVLKACDLYVGSDSGLAHLAAAVETPPVTLFAPARPDEVSPFGYRHLVVQTPAACAPCFGYPRHATTPHVACRVPYCIDQITIDAVMKAVAQASNTDASAADSGTSSACGDA